MGWRMGRISGLLFTTGRDHDVDGHLRSVATRARGQASLAEPEMSDCADHEEDQGDPVGSDHGRECRVQ